MSTVLDEIGNEVISYSGLSSIEDPILQVRNQIYFTLLLF